MKIALITDIHGNTVALNHVLNDAQKSKVDKIICLGDSFINGPDPLGTLRILQSNNIPSVRGNTEDFISDAFRTNQQSERFLSLKDPIRQSVGWCADVFNEHDIKYLESLPLTINVDLPHELSLLCYHASPNSNTELLKENSDNDFFESLVQKYPADFYAGGHTHTAYIKKYMGKTFLNPGCLGIPIAKIDSERNLTLYSGTEYMILEVSQSGNIDISFKRINLPKEELLEMINNSEMPNQSVRYNLIECAVIG